MIKEIISNTAIVLDAQNPTETNKVLFKEISSIYYSNTQEEVFTVNSYKVIDDVESDYEFIKTHSRRIGKNTLDAMKTAITIDSTSYTDIRNEELIKGMAMIIDSDGIFGLTSNDITLR